MIRQRDLQLHNNQYSREYPYYNSISNFEIINDFLGQAQGLIKGNQFPDQEYYLRNSHQFKEGQMPNPYLEREAICPRCSGRRQLFNIEHYMENEKLSSGNFNRNKYNQNSGDPSYRLYDEEDFIHANRETKYQSHAKNSSAKNSYPKYYESKNRPKERKNDKLRNSNRDYNRGENNFAKNKNRKDIYQNKS